jgi:hypothetical protein
MRLYQFAVMAASKTPDAPSFDPNKVLSQTQALAVAALSLVLIGISLVTAFTVGTKGNFSRGAAIVLTVLICLIPGGIGLTYSMRTFLPGLTGWLF